MLCRTAPGACLLPRRPIVVVSNGTRRGQAALSGHPRRRSGAPARQCADQRGRESRAAGEPRERKTLRSRLSSDLFGLFVPPRLVADAIAHFERRDFGSCSIRRAGAPVAHHCRPLRGIGEELSEVLVHPLAFHLRRAAQSQSAAHSSATRAPLIVCSSVLSDVVVQEHRRDVDLILAVELCHLELRQQQLGERHGCRVDIEPVSQRQPVRISKLPTNTSSRRRCAVSENNSLRCPLSASTAVGLVAALVRSFSTRPDSR